MASRLIGRYINMSEFSFKKNGTCIKSDENEQKGAEEHYRQRKVPIIFLE